MKSTYNSEKCPVLWGDLGGMCHLARVLKNPGITPHTFVAIAGAQGIFYQPNGGGRRATFRTDCNGALLFHGVCW